jgi:hypothetical protein
MAWCHPAGKHPAELGDALEDAPRANASYQYGYGADPNGERSREYQGFTLIHYTVKRCYRSDITPKQATESIE